MKKLKFLLLGVMTASLAGALAACTDDGTQTYTFTFDTRGGSAISSLELKEGDTVTRPADPTKAMFTFDDWYTDTSLSTVYTFGTMPAQDVTVYAAWTPETNVRVKYDLMYEPAETVVADSIGLIGSAFKQPDAPTRTGYVFGGWFTDPACTEDTRYAFTVFPAENMTLYAKWLTDGAYAYITYYGNGVQLADPVPVLLGTTFEDPAASFFGDDVVTNGWFTNADRTNAFEGGAVNGNLNLYTTYYTKGLSFSAGTVTGYNGTSRQVFVPDFYEEIPVTAVGEGAFRDSDVRSILLPEGITTVGKSAFYGSRYLTSVNLTENVTSIGAYAFADAQRLESFGTLAVSEIPEGLFLGCNQLDTAVIGGEPTSIGALAFADCATLKEFTVPDTVTTIGAQAFENCSLLTTIRLSAALTSLGENALAGCTALTSVTISDSNADYTVEDGNLYEGARLLRYVAGDKEETSFTLPAGKLSVGSYAFEKNANLTELVFAENTDIARGAFAGMSALNKLTLPASVFENAYLASFFGAEKEETSGSYSFYIPATLTEVAFAGELSVIGNYAFYGATGLSSVSGIGNVTSIGDGAFAYTAITSFELPATVNSFGSRVFEGNSLAAYAVAAGNSAYRASDGCLYSTDGALIAVPAAKTEVSIEAGTTAIGDYAFFDSAVTALTVPDSVTSIGFAAFGNMQSLTSLTVPFVGDGEENAYMGYVFGVSMRLVPVESDLVDSSALYVSLPGRLPKSLQSINITKPCTQLSDMAFALLSNLDTIAFPEGNTLASYGKYSFYNTAVAAWDFTGATAIGESAFQKTKLTSVDLPGTLGANIGNAAFAEIAPLAEIKLGEGITYIATNMFLAPETEGESDDSGYTYNVRRSAVNHEVVIPASVTEIGLQAFLGLGTAEYFDPAYPEEQPEAYTHATRNENFSVTFAEGSKLAKIGGYAFSCSGLESITLPATLETVEQNAFVFNLFLKAVTFGNEKEGSNLKTLGANIFIGDEALESVTLYGAEVAEMTLSGEVHIFYNTNETFAVYVPQSLVKAYQAANGWALVKEHIRAIGSEGGIA